MLDSREKVHERLVRCNSNTEQHSESEVASCWYQARPETAHART